MYWDSTSKGQRPFGGSRSQRSQATAVAGLEIFDHQLVTAFDQAERKIYAFQVSCHYCLRQGLLLEEQIQQKSWIRQAKQSAY
jgi:hypothetical protein